MELIRLNLFDKLFFLYVLLNAPLLNQQLAIREGGISGFIK